MKLTLVTAKQSISVSTKDHKRSVTMNTKDLSGIVIVKRINLWNIVGKQITTLAGLRRKLLLEKAG